MSTARAKRRVLHEGPVGRWVEEVVALPNGNHATLQLLQHPGAAAVVPFVSPDRILLLRQYRHAAGGFIWEVPAGKLDPGEAPEHCAARELEEETGYRAGRLQRTGSILTTPGFTDERIHLFCAFDLVPGQLAQEDQEVIEVHELEFSRVIEMMNREEIVDAKTIAALFHAARTRASA